MKTLGSLVAFASLACISGSLVVGCGCDPGNNSVRQAIEFTPSSVHALRTPATCGATEPAYTTGDTFALNLTGETDVAPPFTQLTLRVPASVPQNQALPLTVSQGSSSGAVTASSDYDAIQFSFTPGSLTTELDATPLDSVVVTITSLPTADGAPFAAELHLTFEDGRVLDQVYSAPVQSIFVSCS